MLISLYLLIVLYTNSMGLIIISKLDPLINKKIEEKGYIKRDKKDEELLKSIIINGAMFLIPGYYLKKALKISLSDDKIDKLIEEKVNNNEMISIFETETSEVDSVFKNEEKLSLGKYENHDTYKAIPNDKGNTLSSMYTDTRYSSKEDVDMDFWEDEEKDMEPYLEEEIESLNVQAKKEPIEEYLDSFSEDELIKMIKQIEIIRKLKKDSEKFLNS